MSQEQPGQAVSHESAPLYLTPGRNDPLEPVVFGAASKHTGLLGLRLGVCAAHAFRQDFHLGRTSTLAVDIPFLNTSPTSLGAL